MGFDQFIPPFVTARGRDILVGVNYASGAAGIRDECRTSENPRGIGLAIFHCLLDLI